MKKLIAAIIVALPLFATSVFAGDPTPQQSKMAACSKENKGLKGDEYKKAQKECLSKDSVPAKAATKAAAPAAASDKPIASQKNKMAACSKENKGLKGDEYKKAQKECLSK